MIRKKAVRVRQTSWAGRAGGRRPKDPQKPQIGDDARSVNGLVWDRADPQRRRPHRVVHVWPPSGRNWATISTTGQRPRPSFTNRTRPAPSSARRPRSIWPADCRTFFRTAAETRIAPVLFVTPRTNHRARPAGRAGFRSCAARATHSSGIGPQMKGSACGRRRRPGLGGGGRSPTEAAP